MSHAAFIVSAYTAAALILGGLILASIVDFFRQRARLAARMADERDGEA